MIAGHSPSVASKLEIRESQVPMTEHQDTPLGRGWGDRKGRSSMGLDPALPDTPPNNLRTVEHEKCNFLGG